jgi:hypothetical protein
MPAHRATAQGKDEAGAPAVAGERERRRRLASMGREEVLFCITVYAEVKCLSGLHCLLEGVLPSQKYCARGIFAFALYCWT